MFERKSYSWCCRARTLPLGGHTLVMGILNATPDSFSDGGRFFDPSAAVERALEMAEQGADIIDVGGESTRPGADAVSEAEEIRRTVPVVGKIREYSTVPISIDTTKAVVAFQALEAGADIVNDVSALEADGAMAGVVAQSGAGVVLMHRRGLPKTMQDDPRYADVVREVRDYLAARAEACLEAGIGRERIVVDPGIGFGKSTEHNLELLRGLPELAACGYPLLIGASRKRFIGEISGRERAAERLGGSLGAAAWAALRGAHILRVHDIIETCDACRLLDRLRDGDCLCN